MTAALPASQRDQFGPRIRAARLGFGWLECLSSWMRITQEPGGRFLIEICADILHLSKGRPAGAKEHACWWEGSPDGSEYVKRCKPLRDVIQAKASGFYIKPHAMLLVDEDGELVR